VPQRRLIGRLLLSAAIAVTTGGCDVAYKTDLLRKDVLTDAQTAIADAQLSHGDLTVEGSVDRADTTYEPGQPITLSVKANKDAFVAILRVLANGETAIVFPNRAERGAANPANTVLTVPAAGTGVKITADKPGVVLFIFIASTANDSWVFKRAADPGSDFANLGATTRNIAKDLLSSLKVGAGPQTAASHLTVRISGRSLF
jgi:hypothetical protein